MWVDRYANFDLTTGLNDGTSEANAWQSLAAMQAGYAAGQRINIKRQAVPMLINNVDVAVTMNGTPTAPLWVRCYENLPGDGGLWAINYTGNMGGITWNCDYTIYEGIEFLPYPTGVNMNGIVFNGINSVVVRCRLYPPCRIRAPSLFFCDLTGWWGGDHQVLELGGSNTHCSVLFGCRIRRVTHPEGVALYPIVATDMYARSIYVDSCLFEGRRDRDNEHPGLHLARLNDGRGVVVKNCVFHHFTDAVTGDYEASTARNGLILINNIFHDISGSILNIDGAYAGYSKLFGNAYYDCAAQGDWPEEANLLGNLELTASPFVDAPNGDFTLNEAAGGGALLRARGFPVLPAFDWDTMQFRSTYQGPSPEAIAQAIWERTGRSLS